MKIKIKKLALSLCLLSTWIAPVSCTDFDEQTKEEKLYEASIYFDVANLNLRSIQSRNNGWSSNDFYEYVTKYHQRTKNPDPWCKRQQACRVLGMLYAQQPSIDNGILDRTTWEDLEILCGPGVEKPYLAQLVNSTRTSAAQVQFLYHLAFPTANANLIRQRQKVIKAFLENEPLQKQCNQLCRTMAKSENFVLPFLDGKDHLYQNVSTALFQAFPLNYFNQSRHALSCISFASLVEQTVGVGASILATVLLPLYGLTNVMRVKLPSLIQSTTNLVNRDPSFYFTISKKFAEQFSVESKTCSGCKQEIKPDLQQPKNIRFNCLLVVAGWYYGATLKHKLRDFAGRVLLYRILQDQLIHVGNYIRAIKKMVQLAGRSKAIVANFTKFKELQKLILKPGLESKKYQRLMQMLEKKTFMGNASLAANHGNILLTYQLIHDTDVQHSLTKLVAGAAELEMLLGIAQLMASHKQSHAKYCFVDLLESDRPEINLIDFWNPFVGPIKSVTNSICLGNGHQNNHLIVTGPNAGGKSSILKSCALNLILGQTFGIAAATQAAITPFYAIKTHLNITDDTSGGNSLFMSEVHRAQHIFDTFAQAGKNQFCFAIMDELFNGTTPKEGEAAAYGFAKSCGEYENGIMMIATHFPLLTTLARECNAFGNSHVSVHKYPDGSFAYPFTLAPGISDQHIAFDILKQQGFKSSILETAQQVLGSSHTLQ